MTRFRVYRPYASIIASAIGTAGVLLIASDDELRTNPTTKIAYDEFDPRAWGALFLLSAVVFFVFRRRRAAAAPMAFVMTSWALMLAWAALFTAEASPTAWVWPLCLSVLLLSGIARGDL
jgi:hypothetical protein